MATKTSIFLETLFSCLSFQWDKARASPFSGALIVVNLRCKKNPRKKGVFFSSCFMFKTRGTQTGNLKLIALIRVESNPS